MTELAARLITNITGRCHPICFTEYDPTRGWVNAPGSVARHRDPELGFDVTYTIGPQGFRGHEPTHGKRPGIPRILVLGDSNGFGFGVREGQEFPARLEQALGRVEVANLSVTGYGTDQEYLQFQQVGLLLSPDIVVLQVTPNDFDDIGRTFVAGRPKPRFTMKLGSLALHNVPVGVEAEDRDRFVGSPLPLAFRWWLARRSYAFAWLNERERPTRFRGVAEERFSADGVALFRNLVSALASETSRVGAELVVVHASSEIAARHEFAFPPGIATIDVSNGFRDADALYADGLHWNEVGHALLAKYVAEWYTSRARR